VKSAASESATPSNGRSLSRTFDVTHDAREVRAVRAALTGLAGKLGFEKKKVRELTLALGEALDNALEHGCHPGGHVSVQFRVLPGQLTLVVEDPGNGSSAVRPSFDRVATDQTSEELFRGRGLYLIRAVMDNVKAEDLPAGGTRVIMVKYR
jgi:serine/threonine-protein kinase RsbW